MRWLLNVDAGTQGDPRSAAWNFEANQAPRRAAASRVRAETRGAEKRTSSSQFYRIPAGQPWEEVTQPLRASLPPRVKRGYGGWTDEGWQCRQRSRRRESRPSWLSPMSPFSALDTLPGALRGSPLTS